MSQRWVLLGFLTATLIALPVGGVVVVDAAAAKKHHKKHHHKKHKNGPCGGNGVGGELQGTQSPSPSYDVAFRCTVSFSSFTVTTTKAVDGTPTASVINGMSAGTPWSCQRTGVHSFSCSGPTLSPESDLGGTTGDVRAEFFSSDACTTFNQYFYFHGTIPGKPASKIIMKCVHT